MADIEEVRQIKGRRITANDWAAMADFVIEEQARRKKGRKDLEEQWKEIDRQLRMEPDNKVKRDAKGKVDPNRAWMAEMELPLQAQTLEVLTADARRMLFPDSGPWFEANAALTDDYLDRVDFQALISGDETEVPSQINQDNANQLTAGWLQHLHRQYDLLGAMDMINAEAFKYGVGVGRMRPAKKDVFIDTAKGVSNKSKTLPVFFPRSIKNTYLDDREYAIHRTGHILGPAVIHEEFWSFDDLMLAAKRGSKEPTAENGGWRPKGLEGLERPEGPVRVLEYEGDLVVPRKSTRSLFLPGVILTVAVGDKRNNEATRGVVRVRFRKDPFTSYIKFPYHVEDLTSAYPTSPLMKARPVQQAATFALNRLMDSSMLKVSPPIGYDDSDPYFSTKGGPNVAPFAQWATADINALKVFVEVGGDPSTLKDTYLALLSQYADLTGVNAPRLGAQTNSHTTAFAKDAELQRGQIRTVDYVRTVGHGPLRQFLEMEFQMGKRLMRGTETVFIEPYGGFVDIGKDALPDKVSFEWLGAAAPADREQEFERQFSALQQAIQLDTLKAQLGEQPSIDIDAAQREILRKGGWTDIDALFRSAAALDGAGGQPGVAGTAAGSPAATLAALSEVSG